MVIPHSHQHTTMCGRACHIGMAHHITGTVHPRAFTVPQAKHTVVLAFAAQLCLLTAPKGGSGKIFVQARLEHDVMRGQRLGGALHLQVHGPQGRPAVSGHIARGV